MPEKVVQAKSLEDIKKEWALKLNIQPEDVKIEVIDKPSFFSRQWKVRVIWEEQKEAPILKPSRTTWDGNKYNIMLGEGVKQIIPAMEAGEVWLNGALKDKSFHVSLEDRVEFHPIVQPGRLTWEMDVRFQGLSAVAKVWQEKPGRYILAEDIPATETIDLIQFITWESLPAQGEIWDQAKLNADFEKLNIVHGRRQKVWEEITAVSGMKEVVVAEATLPVPPKNAKLVDFVGESQVESADDDKKIDFFASKVKLVKEGAVLARKIPASPGIPGKDILGRDLPAATAKDFVFCLKKNVSLSPDGLEVIADTSGNPVRSNEKTYSVEQVYILNKDVDLANGSIEFPGDVFINGNVLDGLRVFAGGKLEIQGSVSHAVIRAEKGAKIHQNLLGGKVIIGEKFVVRSELLRLITEMHNQISLCLKYTTELIRSSGASNLKPGQCLKLVIEKQFSTLPKLSNAVEKFVLDNQGEEMISEGLILSVRTAKRFLTGLGPLEIQSIPLLERVDQALEQFSDNLNLEMSDDLSLYVSYVQGTNIECGGSFVCKKGTYNSNIRVEGDVKIDGVCRGGKIFAGGKVQIRELGGSEVSSTYVQISPDSRLNVEYCHANVVIAVGKEIINIEEAYRNLEIYRENGVVQFEKLRAKPNY